jgi:hypothetical protein
MRRDGAWDDRVYANLGSILGCELARKDTHRL